MLKPLLLLLSHAAALAQNATAPCPTKTFAEDMGSGGGWMMFGIGLIAGLLLMLAGWYILKKRREAQEAPTSGRVIATPIQLSHMRFYGPVSTTEGFI